MPSQTTTVRNEVFKRLSAYYDSTNVITYIFYCIETIGTQLTTSRLGLGYKNFDSAFT